MSISTKQLKQMKEELRKFSSLETSKIYAMISQIYKAKITPQQLIDSEITKSLARIALKQQDQLSEDEKRQKSVKIARKLVKQWKQTLGYYEAFGQKNEIQEVVDPIRKQIKRDQYKTEENDISTLDQEIKSQKVGKNVPEKKEQISEKKLIKDIKYKQNEFSVDQETRDKAVQGLIKYLKKHDPDCDQDIAVQLETQSFIQNKNNIDEYKQKVKNIVITIDKNEDFRQKLFNKSVSVKEILKSL